MWALHCVISCLIQTSKLLAQCHLLHRASNLATAVVEEKSRNKDGWEGKTFELAHARSRVYQRHLYDYVCSVIGL